MQGQIVRFALYFFMSLRIIKAKSIFNGEKFIQENVLVIKDNRIVDLFFSESNENITELYDGILVPGFVNAHCHLELSYLHHQFEHYQELLGFIRQMFQKRNLFNEKEIISQAEYWDKKMYENGIVAVGDIVNTIHTLNIKVQSPIHYINFIEVFGLLADKSELIFHKSTELQTTFLNHHLSAFLAAHAPYSLSNPLWYLLLNYYKNNTQQITSSLHFLESSDEKNLLTNRDSLMRTFFEKEFNLKQYELTQISYNFETYFQQLVKHSKTTILVHSTFWKGEYQNIINSFKNKIFFCLCPNANLLIEQKLPDVDYISSYSDNICLGTDSLASNFNLSIVDEMNVLLTNFPQLSIEKVLKWGTSNGAKALNLNTKIGYIKMNCTLPLNVIEIKGRKIIHKGMIK
ncbi:MAG: amidohydrolase [Bacteroidia bacterium]|nr:MAG: amidohydrolase [Bacteroidia bacterium]